MYSFDRQRTQSKRAARLRQRFEADYLPRFGDVWRSMVEQRKTSISSTPKLNRSKPSSMNFAEAIERKISVKMQVPTNTRHANEGADCECEGCVPPIEDFEYSGDDAPPVEGRVKKGDVRKKEYLWRERQDSEASSDESLDSDNKDFIDDDSLDDRSAALGEHEASTPLPSGLNDGFEKMFLFGEKKDQPLGVDEVHADDLSNKKDETPGKQHVHASSTDTSGSEIVSFDVSHILDASPSKADANMECSLFPQQPQPQFSPGAEGQPHLSTIADHEDSIGDSSSNSSGYQIDLSYMAHSPPSKSESIERKAEETILHADEMSKSKGRSADAGYNHHQDSHSFIIDLLDSDDDEDEEAFPFTKPQTQALDARQEPEVLVDSSDESIGKQKAPSRPKKIPLIYDDNESSEGYVWDGSSGSQSSFVSLADFENDSTNFGRKYTAKFDKTIRRSIDAENVHPNGASEAKRNDTFMSVASFKKNRGALSKKFFDEYNAVAFEGKLSAVQVVWSNKLLTTAGQTRLSRQRVDFTPGASPTHFATVELSTKVLDDSKRLQSTLLHEMCHAAAWVVDGVSKPPHGTCFKKWAAVATCRIPGSEVTTTHDYKIQYKYAWACTKPGCTFLVQRHSRSIDVNRQLCGRCRGRLMEVEVPNHSSKNTVQRAPKKRAPLSGYNLFVREHSKAIRERLAKQNVKVSQSDVMKECARLWQEKKQSQRGNE